MAQMRSCDKWECDFKTAQEGGKWGKRLGGGRERRRMGV